jgi:hypothetical protein
LRDVRRSLDVEIERLGTRLKILNIALVPALLAIGAIVLAFMRRSGCAPAALPLTRVKGSLS